MISFYRSILAAVGLSLGFGYLSHGAEVFFTPSVECEDGIVEAIKNSKFEVDAVVYSINNDKIVRAIQEAHRRGLKIRILTDSLQASGRSSKVATLKKSGIDIRLHSKHKIEHNKFAWFDGKSAVNGSFNWTNPASKENSENCVFFKEENIIASYKSRFEELWKMNSEEKSRLKFAKLLKKISNREIASER